MAGQTIGHRPSIVNLLLYSGDGFSIRLVCKDEADQIVDINGSVSAQIRPDRIHPEDDALADFTVVLTDGYLGIINLSLTGAQTDALLADDKEAFTGVWDVQWTPAGFEPRTLVQGSVECVADVTK